MKLAFSTLGCPNWELEEIAETASRLGYEAIELRALGGDLDLLARPEFQSNTRLETRRWLEDKGLAICCVDTSCNFHSLSAEERSTQVAIAIAHGDLAAALGAPMIRVFPDKVQAGATRDETRDNIAASLREVAQRLPEGVRVGLETHGDFARGEIAAEIVRRADHPDVCLIWDVANSMAAGDSIEEAAKLVSPYLAHVHLRDARDVGAEHWLPVLAGRGRVSFEVAIRELRCLKYDAYLSFEWEKFWHPEIEEPEVALPDFADSIKEILKADWTTA